MAKPVGEEAVAAPRSARPAVTPPAGAVAARERAGQPGRARPVAVPPAEPAPGFVRP